MIDSIRDIRVSIFLSFDRTVSMYTVFMEDSQEITGTVIEIIGKVVFSIFSVQTILVDSGNFDYKRSKKEIQLGRKRF